MTKQCQHIIAGILFFLAAFFVAQQQSYETDSKTIQSTIISIDTTLLFQKIVIPNRLTQFCHYLQQHNIRVDNNYELLLLLSNPNTRRQLHHHFQMDTSILLMHAELADLMQINISELDVQILYFSQRNYQNPFTDETINLNTLSEADAERVLQDIGGWLAGNDNPILQNYCLSIEDIESWISKANAYQFKIFAQIF